MIFIVLLLFGVMAFPGLAWAEIAKVRSGEHAGFSRLVVTLNEPSGWTFGRNEDGYELRVDRAGITFDLEQVFARIPKTRIGDVSAGVSSLTVTASCACHAEFFEFRPGILVIDLKDGEPPQGSRFERILDLRQPEGDVSSIPYDRRTPDDKARSKIASESLAVPLPIPKLRDSVLRELSLGASRGVVEMALPSVSNSGEAVQVTRQVVITPEAGFDSHQGDQTLPELHDSEICIDDSLLAIQYWGQADDPAATYARTRDGLLKDFDKPDPNAVKRAAQAYLFLGFGREARQLVKNLAPEMPDAALLEALGSLIDGEGDQEGKFSGMENCSSAAALWSVLARPHLRPSEKISAAEITRAFSELPPDLRRTLVLSLGERLLEQGDYESARRVKDAVDRISGAGATGAALMGAKLLIHGGETAQAQEKLTAIAGERGSFEPEALIDQVRLAASQKSAVPPTLAADLSLLVQNYKGHALEAELLHAMVLAEALSGDFAAAMRGVERSPESQAEVWSLLAQIGPQSAVLDFAIFGQGIRTPKVARETGVKLAERLVKQGFPDAAALWLSAAAPDPSTRTEPERLLFAEIALAGNDAQDVFRHLAGITGRAADVLRADAQMQLGDFSGAGKTLAQTNNLDTVRQMERLAQNWEAVAAKDVGVWQKAAASVEKEPPADLQERGPTLVAANQIAAESQSVRETFNALLALPVADNR